MSEPIQLPFALQLLTHAATPAMRKGYFPHDDALDARGIQEATAEKGQLPVPQNAVIYCSPARCALQTAKALGWDNVRVEPALRDIDYGRWRGMRLRDVAIAEPAAAQAWLEDPELAPHGGESFADVLQRVSGWIDALRSDVPVVCVTHALIVQAAMSHVRGEGIRGMYRGELSAMRLNLVT